MNGFVGDVVAYSIIAMLAGFVGLCFEAGRQVYLRASRRAADVPAPLTVPFGLERFEKMADLRSHLITHAGMANAAAMSAGEPIDATRILAQRVQMLEAVRRFVPSGAPVLAQDIVEEIARCRAQSLEAARSEPEMSCN